MRIKELLKKNSGQALVETVLVIITALLLVMMILQFSLLVAVHLAANYACYRAGRAIYVSANRQTEYGYGSSASRSAYKDAKDAADKVLYAVSLRGWALPFWSVKLYYHQGGGQSGVGSEISESQTVLHNQDVWVHITIKARIVIPLTKYIFSDGAPFLPMPWKTIKTASLVHTPHRGEYP